MSREGPQVEKSVTRFTSKSKWGHDPEPCESWRHAAQPAPHFREGLALERGADVWGGREKKGRGVFSTVPARPRRLRATGQPCRSASRDRKASEEKDIWSPPERGLGRLTPSLRNPKRQTEVCDRSVRRAALGGQCVLGVGLRTGLRTEPGLAEGLGPARQEARRASCHLVFQEGDFLSPEAAAAEPTL